MYSIALLRKIETTLQRIAQATYPTALNDWLSWKI